MIYRKIWIFFDFYHNYSVFLGQKPPQLISK